MKETELNLKILGDAVLRKRSKQVKDIDARIRNILSKMSRIMYDFKGIGLAAPQIGLDEAMIVVDIGQGLFKLVNPKIMQRIGQQAIEEGCLSVPGIQVKIPRAKEIVVQACDENGKKICFEAKDLLACVIQHEIDHLHGKLIIDYVPWGSKSKVLKKFEEFKKKNENLSKSEAKSAKM